MKSMREVIFLRHGCSAPQRYGAPAMLTRADVAPPSVRRQQLVALQSYGSQVRMPS
jgi:hypothetical protein